MKSPHEVYEDYAGRRRGIIKALTTDVDSFYKQCDPNRENLTLFAFPDGTWAVDLPAEEVPPEVPEPALGINFARDGMQRKDWLGVVAVHSDAWLMATAFYKGARFNKDERQELFRLINQQPTCYEVVSGKVRVPQQQQQQQQQTGPGTAQLTGVKRQAPPPASTGPTSARPNYRGSEQRKMEQQSDQESEDDGWQDGEGDPCPMCGRIYSQNEFWIACDSCDTWYCGRCTKMTASKAEKMKVWKCPTCGGQPV